MASHRGLTRRAGVRPGQDVDRTTAQPDGAAVPVEEDTLFAVDVTPRPDGFGTEASTSLQSFQVLDSYVVPDKSLGRLSELSLSIEANGEAKVSVAGTTYGPFTGGLDVSVPLQNAVLPPGYEIRVHHQSTDGNSTTTRATAVVLEV